MNDAFTAPALYSAEAEQSVLGAMFIDERCIPDVLDELSPNDFYLNANKDIYTVICGMADRGKSIDLVTILDELRSAGRYTEGETDRYILNLMEITPTASNVMTYVGIVKDRSTRRQLKEVAGAIIAVAISNERPASEGIDVAEQLIYDLRKGKEIHGLEHISTVLQAMYEDVGKRAQSSKEYPGLPTGFGDIDRAISGLNESDLIILAARPGMGKTAMAMNIAMNVGKYSGQAVAVFSLEMSKSQLAMRIVAGECYVDVKKIKTAKELTPEDWQKIGAAASSLSRTRIYMDDNPSLSASDISSACRRVENLGLVVVDYLQLMRSSGYKNTTNENRQQVVADISRSMKIMAKELHVPVICLSQLSRSNEKDGKVRQPRLSDLRESGAIEQDADIVMFLHKDDYYDEESAQKDIAKCIIAKNRHGEVGTIELQWLPEFTSFRSIERRYDTAYAESL